MLDEPAAHELQFTDSPGGDTVAHARTDGVPSDSHAEPARSVAQLRLRLLIAVAACTLLATVCWLGRRSLAALTERVEIQSEALAQMNTDAMRIRALATTPKRATDHNRANEELLGEIEKALGHAGIPLDRWQDSVPQPPQDLPNSPYKKLNTRLYFEDVSLEDIAAFAHRLVEVDPSLEVSSVRINAPRLAQAGWNVELAVSYLIVDERS